MVLRGAWAWVVLVVLALSLVLNFFIAGFLFERGRQFFSGGGNPMIGRLLGEFPSDVRRTSGREMWADRGAFAPLAQSMRERRQAFIEAAREPVLNEARLAALLSEMRSDLDRMQVRAQSALIDALKRMTPEQRAEIGKRGEGWRGGWGGREGWGWGPGYDRPQAP